MFLALAIAFHRDLRVTGAEPKVWRQLYAIYTVLGLITASPPSAHFTHLPNTCPPDPHHLPSS